MNEAMHGDPLAALRFAVVRPTIVCLCGSGRFREAFEEAEFQETLAGRIVLTIGCNTKDIARDVDWSHVKPMLDDLHLHKIRLCDEVLIVNVGGYVGESTSRELAYAKSLGKRIRYWEDEEWSVSTTDHSPGRFDRLAVLAYECVDSAMDMADARPRTKQWRALSAEVIRLIDSGVDFDAMQEERQTIAACRVCGCTDDDCIGCVERTGEPCSWVEPDLCSACSARPVAVAS